MIHPVTHFLYSLLSTPQYQIFLHLKFRCKSSSHSFKTFSLAVLLLWESFWIPSWHTWFSDSCLHLSTKSFSTSNFEAKVLPTALKLSLWQFFCCENHFEYHHDTLDFQTSIYTSVPDPSPPEKFFPCAALKLLIEQLLFCMFWDN